MAKKLLERMILADMFSHIEFNHFRNYLTKMNGFLDQEYSLIEAEFEINHVDVDHEIAMDMYADLNQHRMMLTEAYPNILRESFYISMYSCFEDRLISMCRLVQEELEFPFSLKELNGQLITQARKYLEKVGAIEFTSFETHWKDALFINRIRNNITHQRGDLDPKKDKELIEAIARTKGYAVSSRSQIEISAQACFEASHHLESIISGISLEFQKRPK
jgi:hypothetical protein